MSPSAFGKALSATCLAPPTPLPLNPRPQVLQALWDGSEATGLVTHQRLEGLLSLMRRLAKGYQLGVEEE